MATSARNLGIIAGLLTLLIAFVALGTLALTLAADGYRDNFSSVWFFASVGLGLAMLYGAMQAECDPSLCCLIQYLAGSFSLLFFVPNAAICLDVPAFALFGLSVGLAFASGTAAHRSTQTSNDSNTTNPYTRSRRWI